MSREISKLQYSNAARMSFRAYEYKKNELADKAAKKEIKL